MSVLNNKSIVLRIATFIENTSDIIHLWRVNKTNFQVLLPMVEKKYKEYVEEQQWNIVTHMNFKAKLIDEFSTHTPLVRNTMFEYIIMCYEHWYILSYNNNLRNKLLIPNNKLFNDFLREKSIEINKIFHEPFTHCTSYHRPSKSISYFRTLTI